MSTILFGLLLVFISVSVIITNQQGQTLVALERIARDVERQAYELGYLSGDYLLYHENQQLTRWEAVFAAFSDDLNRLDVTAPEQRALVDNIKTNQERLRAVFAEVRAAVDASTPARVDPAFVQVSWSRMTVQTQSIIFNASQLATILDDREAQLKQANILLMFVLIGVFGSFLFVTYLLTYRRTLASIARLQAGTAVIGSGNLDFTIEEKWNDEIGDLSRSFNRMTASLKEVTASKVDLEKEIAERKKAQERASHQKAVQASINRILQAYLTFPTEEELGVFCLKLAEEVTQSQFGFIGEIGADGSLHDTAMSAMGWEQCAMQDKTGHRRPLGSFKLYGLYGRVLKDGKGFFSNNPPAHPDSIGTPSDHPLIKSFLGVPLIHGGKTTGMIGLANREGGYRQEDLEALEALAPAILETMMRKRAEAQIHHLATFPELNPSPIVEMDAAGNVKYVNAAARKYFPNLPTQGSRHPYLVDWKALVSVLQSGEQQLFSRDVTIGESCFLQMVTFVPDPQTFRVYGQDITERRRAEQALEQRGAELEAANKELEAFAYSVSHDLRAPLRSMEGFSVALGEDYADKLDDRGKQYLKYIQDSSELMARLIDDLLKLSRVTRSEMTRERVNLSAMAQEIIADLQKTQPERSVKVSITPDMAAYGDRALLRLMLENLLNNAWKFTAKTTAPAIEMGVTSRHGQRAYYVRDNGVGFDMAYANKLFQPFQRLHKATEFPGTGIGLATVQRIIRRHSGEVWAESKLGEGATLSFTLS